MTDDNVLINEPANRTSSTLLVRVQAADQAAWRKLVDVYSPLVYRWCRRAQLQPNDASDVGQEVFVAVARKIGDFRRATTGSFRAWLRAITSNKVRDWYRSHAQQPHGRGGSDAARLLHEQCAMVDSDDDHDQDDERTLVFHAALAALKPEFEGKTWAAFWAVVVEGDSASEVAQRLCMSRNAVYLAKSRILARLREEFEGLVDMD